MLTVRQLLDYLTGQPDETPVVVDVNAGGWYLRVEDLNVTTAQDATPGGDPLEGVEINISWEPGDRGWTINDPSKTLFTLDDVDELIAERDALRRELSDLRAGLCFSLRKYHSEPGPQGLVVRSVLTDQEIFAEIERLRTITAEPSSEP
ncbi:unnamed protein product [[Actinomadura] parvosata subsp. kistnae]|uniref:Uncharacterized protein n=1 Tax=[Actinomadura] parvosata subsp. kistnae TaxID=1909395 RepID=A0A1V0AAA7_9ACTN|nr:hypothetical protein [Nonomuraea sp. ATCC 55076]AQZ67135.1 hypothetical protein BKM31_41865 [Nonomuraea sp. ATCC 55076]SPL94664.1 unnamed protein product [Actinomadura parvosata subsp. kistnae]